jgi:nucleoside-diphosphate-sugar epimerase
MPPMKVFVAGATGAVGRPLIPLLVRAGHTVVGMTRSAEKADAVRSAGAEPAVANALDPAVVMAVVQAAQPDVVVHELTAIPPRLDIRKIGEQFALTNRLRREGTDNLLAAALAAGAKRFVAQSFGGWPYAREGGPVKTEEDPLDPDPPEAMRDILDAIRHLETTVSGAQGIEGVVLRYGPFYGPGTSVGKGGSMLEDIRRRRMPVVGKGTGVWSFCHIDDAARATVAAIDKGAPGIYNIVDDEPAQVFEWLPALAKAAGGKPPRRVPAWLARLIVGPAAVAMMTEARGASNAKAKRDLGFEPRWKSWREGFANGLGSA